MKNLKLLRNLSMRQLRVFLSAARHMSFSKAAAELNLTAPAVSMQIKELESDLDIALFARVGRRVELTTAGEYFLVYVKRIAANLRDAEVTLSKLRGTDAGALKIGLVSTAKYFLPQLLARFKEEHFGLQIRLEVRNRDQMVELLRDGEIDFLEGRMMTVSIDDAAIAFTLTVENGRLLALKAVDDPDLPIAGDAFAILQLATRAEDSDTLFFRRQLSTTGDTDLGLYLKNFLDGLDPESLPLHQLTGPLLRLGAGIARRF